jgi:lipid-A-disaccharide synthase
MKKIFIVAGEASGDMHGASLIRAIKQKKAEVCFCGLGGKKMEEAGVELSYNLVDIAVLGLFEVLKKCVTFKKIFDETVAHLDRERFDCVILIDYPGFNLRFAKEVKKRKIPLIYYISPQVWAWDRGRVELIRQLVDKIIVLFKFEEDLYRREGLDVSFVGHPLVDTVKPTLSEKERQQCFNLADDKKTIAFLPGSRQFEVEALLPIMKRAGELIQKQYPSVQFLISRVPSLKKDIFEKLLRDTTITTRLIDDKTYDVITASDMVIAKSGTVTLETAILQKPMIITYKASFLTYVMTRLLIRLPYIGLVNVVAGKKIVPEYLQYNARPHLIAREALTYLKSEEKRTEFREAVKTIKSRLGEAGASERAAQAVMDFLLQKT